MKEKSTFADQRLVLKGQLARLQVLLQEIASEMIPLQSERRRIDGVLAALSSKRADVNSKIHEVIMALATVEMTQLRLDAAADMISGLASENVPLSNSGNPLVRSFAGVTAAILGNESFSEVLPDIIEPDINSFHMRSNGQRIQIRHANDACRLVLTRVGSHLVIYHPLSGTSDFAVVDRIISSIQAELGQSELTASHKVTHGLGIRIDTRNPELTTPVLMVQAGAGTKDAKSLMYPFEVNGDLLPVIEKVGTILAQGMIFSPKQFMGRSKSIVISR